MMRYGLLASAALSAIGISGAAIAADLSWTRPGSTTISLSSTISDPERGSDRAAGEPLASVPTESAAMYGLDPTEFRDVGALEFDVARVAGALGMQVDRSNASFLGRVALHVVDDSSVGSTPIVTDFDDPYMRTLERSQAAVTVYDVTAQGQRTLPRRGLRLDYARPLSSALPGEMEVLFEPRANFTVGDDMSGFGGGAIVRFGRNLTEPRAKASRWYAFIGADAQALTWSLGGRQDHTLRLEDKQLVGDYQIGVARRVAGGDLSLGVVHREIKWNDYSRDEQFVGVSYTRRR